jgi:hypothetical protein
MRVQREATMSPKNSSRTKRTADPIPSVANDASRA